MEKTKHYCDRCNREIKYFFPTSRTIPIRVDENTYEDIIKYNDINIYLHSKHTEYKICGRCYKDFKKFIKNCIK